MNTRRLLGAGLLAAVCSVAWAQYKVVAPDGSVTYTDRPPVSDTAAKVSPLRRGAAAAAAASSAATVDTSLPFDLRQVASRYPVTLYTGADCKTCDTARQWLRQRGVPYVERSIVANADTQALERLTGGRAIPSLSVGAQALRGYNEADWASYIDAAGYPAASRLPRNWQPAAAAPLVPPPAVAAPTAPTSPAAPAIPASGADAGPDIKS